MQWSHDYCKILTDFVVNHIEDFDYILFIKPFHRNRIIYLMDDPADRLYIVKKGRVRLTRINDDGREDLLRVVGEGEHFGCLCLCEEYHRDHLATTEEESRIAMLRPDDFKRVFYRHEQLFTKLLAYFSSRFSNLQEKIAHYEDNHRLLRLMHYFERQIFTHAGIHEIPEEVKIVLSPLYRTIAEQTRIPQKEVEGLLRLLKQEKILEWKRNTITVHTGPFFERFESLMYGEPVRFLSIVYPTRADRSEAEVESELRIGENMEQKTRA